MPKVSLLIPIYNVERYLRECLHSAQAQTLQDIEIICINDGSTDGSRAIIQKFLDSDKRFRVIDKSNSGYGISMNMGLDAATGEWIGILESDDIFEADALKTLVALAEQNNAEVAKGDFWLYWSKPVVRRQAFNIVSSQMCGHVVRPEQEQDIFYRKPSIWSAVYKRSFLKANEIRFLETPGASYQDAGFNFKVWASAQRAVFTMQQILSYRQDNEKSSVNSPGKVFCVCDEYAEMMRWLRERPQKFQQLIGVLQRMRYDSYMWNYERLAPELRMEFLQRASSDFAQLIQDDLVDMSLFDAAAAADLNLLVSSPQQFNQMHDEYPAGSTLDNFKRYNKLGGAKLVGQILAQKIRR